MQVNNIINNELILLMAFQHATATRDGFSHELVIEDIGWAMAEDPSVAINVNVLNHGLNEEQHLECHFDHRNMAIRITNCHKPTPPIQHESV